MKLSIIIPVLNSHEIMRRQYLYWEKIGIPDDIEIIIVDDNSNPPLEYTGNLPLRIYHTNDPRPWTWPVARNIGARIAKGDYILMIDVDHILPREAIDICRNFTGDKVYFVREFGVLTEDGSLTQDREVLKEYGLSGRYLKARTLRFGALPNNICLERKVFWQIGGYREDLIGRPYPQGEDRSFKKAWCNYEKSLGRPPNNEPAPIYMFPNGYYCGDVDYNPKGLFHKLSRAGKFNSKYRRNRLCVLFT